jgi:hypothetical protein
MSEKYISKYSNGKEITAAQYITEIICEHWAKQNQQDLHYRFWSTSEKWQKHYKGQISTANKLVKKYNAKAIIKALNDPKASRIYSLRAPHLPAIIERYEKILEEQKEELTKNFERKENAKFEKNRSKKNIISKLKDLDD